MWHWKSEGVCFVLSELKDQASQIPAVQNVLILNCYIEQKVIRGVQSYINLLHNNTIMFFLLAFKIFFTSWVPHKFLKGYPYMDYQIGMLLLQFNK